MKLIYSDTVLICSILGKSPSSISWTLIYSILLQNMISVLLGKHIPEDIWQLISVYYPQYRILLTAILHLIFSSGCNHFFHIIQLTLLKQIALLKNRVTFSGFYLGMFSLDVVGVVIQHHFPLSWDVLIRCHHRHWRSFSRRTSEKGDVRWVKKYQ